MVCELLASAAAANIASESAKFVDIGFSHQTCLPSFRAATEISLCNEFGTHTEISSTFGSLTKSIHELVQRENPISFRITSALSGL